MRDKDTESRDVPEDSNKYAELENKLLKLFDKFEAGQGQPDSCETGAPPKIIGDFKVIREIGKGGMGTVYEAEQVSLRRKVALKILPSHLSLSDTTVLKFKREAEAGGKQSHPGIVAIYSVDEHEGLHFITQELVPGGVTLSTQLDEIRKGGEQPPGYFRKVAQLVLKVCTAIQHAHEAGVIHRDIKPSNILLTEDGDPKVTDFGLAKIEDALSLSRTGDFSGTPYYMSPEQAMGRRMGIDKRTDIYSLGVTLYEMLTLNRPFEGHTSQDVLKKIMLVDPEFPSKTNPQAPRDLSVICLKAMEKMPDKRYDSMKEFGQDLERFLNGDVILAKPAGPGARMLKRVKRNPVISLLIATVILFALVIPWIMYMNEQAMAQKEKENAKLLKKEKDKAEERLEQILRLSDVKRLSDLQEDGEALWPAYPENISGYEKWLDRANGVLGRMELHQQTLASLRERALPFGEDQLENNRQTHPQWGKLQAMINTKAKLEEKIALKEPGPWKQQLSQVEAQVKELDKAVSVQHVWMFQDTETKWRHDMVAGLVSGLKAISDPKNGLVRSIQERLDFAETIRKKSIHDHQEAWDRAIASVADKDECPLYDGLVIEPKVGFAPIGRDPDSGLWEFAHLQTGVIPVRDKEGNLTLTEEMCLVFVLIPGGVFNMGATRPSKDWPLGAPNVDPNAQSDEVPVHEVTVKPFFLSKYEMTQGQWFRFTKKKPSIYGLERKIAGNRHNLLHPVENVSWNDCSEVLFQLKLRFPTESEWEYAARAGTTTVYFTGNDIQSLEGAANIADACFKKYGGGNFPCQENLNDYYSIHAPVGTFFSNAFGLHDVHGNVFEWCEDPYRSNYKFKMLDSLAILRYATVRVVRGGCWARNAIDCRSADRTGSGATSRGDILGLRPAVSCDLKEY